MTEPRIPKCFIGYHAYWAQKFFSCKCHECRRRIKGGTEHIEIYSDHAPAEALSFCSVICARGWAKSRIIEGLGSEVLDALIFGVEE